MTSAHTDSDLARPRQFLKTLEAEAKIAVGGIDPNAREIEILKREIAISSAFSEKAPMTDRKKFCFGLQ
jgi:hypothetical protein